MASVCITTWQTDGETMETVTDVSFWAPKSLQMVTVVIKLKDSCPLEKSYDKPRQHIKSQDIALPTKVCILRAMVFPLVIYRCEFSSVAHSGPTLYDPMDCSTPGFPIHHQLPETAQTHVHWVGDSIQPSHPLSSPSPPAFNLSQRRGLFQWVSSSHQVAAGFRFSISPSNE